LLDGGEGLRIDSRPTAVSPYSPPRFPQDVTPVDAVQQRVETSTRLPLGCRIQTALELSHFVARIAPRGVIGSGLAGHALTLTSAAVTTTAGTLPSGSVVLHPHRRYYDPLGLPLRNARFRLRLIRVALPRRRPRRRASRVPCPSFNACCAPYPGGTRRACSSGPGRD